MDITENIKLEFREILAETPKAWKVDLLNHGIFWLPKSQCRLINVYAYIPKWLADKEEITYSIFDVV